ncbi:MAG: hypothetical protein ACK521_07665 [bacterium]
MSQRVPNDTNDSKNNMTSREVSPENTFSVNSSILVPKTRFTRVLGDNPLTGSHMTTTMTNALQRHEEKLEKLAFLSKL